MKQELCEQVTSHTSGSLLIVTAGWWLFVDRHTVLCFIVLSAEFMHDVLQIISFQFSNSNIKIAPLHNL